jgi:PDZ domain-containing protein
MMRRGWTVLIGFLLVAGLTALLTTATVPYVQLEPGPTYDTLGQDDDQRDVIEISGASTSESEGELRFVTVGVQPRLTLVEALLGWWRDDDAVVPRELVYPPDQTQEQVEERNAEDFANSQSAAEIAAMEFLQKPMVVKVDQVPDDSPAKGKLQADDVITSIDDVPIASDVQLLETIRAKPVGSTVSMGITRSGVPQTVQVTTFAGEDGASRIGFRPKIGWDPIVLDIPIEGIGGPSAGLMLSLGIIDKLQPEDLTGGHVIAGTGTIDRAGAVGEIGGVPQKLDGAKAAGATYFLTPTGNCAEAVANDPGGLTLVQVSSLSEALTALAAIRSGEQPVLCPGA